MSDEIKNKEQNEKEVEKNSAENSNNENAENENIEPDVSDLESEAINTRKLQAVGVIAFAFVILILVGLNFLSKRKHSDEVKKEVEIGTKVQNNDLSYKKQSFKELVLETPAVEQLAEQNTSDEKEDNPFNKNTTKAKFEPKVFKGSSSMMIANSSNGKAGSETNGETPPDVLSGEYTFDENGKLVKKEEVGKSVGEDSSYTGDVFSPKSAKLNKFDPNLYIAKGTYIGCSLNTRLVSTIKGGISCTVSEDVYSDNGVTLLIEKGSKITGSYRNGQMNDGMDRIFVVWQEIKTPNNVIIPVNSGASDELGGAGIEGWVDYHWAQRFGAAILLSIIDDATNVALNGGKGGRSNSNVDYTENSRETTQQMANTALEKFINIEPTLYKNQGDIVGVYVNRDIDFSKVYKLRVKKGIRK